MTVTGSKGTIIDTTASDGMTQSEWESSKKFTIANALNDGGQMQTTIINNSAEQRAPARALLHVPLKFL